MKTIFIILLILVALYLIVWQLVGLLTLIKGFNKRERESVNRWFLTISLLGLFGLSTQWIMFFPAWWQRHKGENSWFWWWMDDSRLGSFPIGPVYSKDYEVFLDGRNETIWLAYQWHMRNRIWNLYTSRVPIQSGEITIVKMISDNLTMNGEKIDQTLSWAPMARLKYWKNGKEGSQVNNGDAISAKHSIFGDGYFWYEDNGVLYFRYSKLVRFNYIFWKGWRTIQMGTNAKRDTSTIKHQAFKEII